jgi:hypothetical protein
LFTAMMVPVASNTATCADKLSSVDRSSASTSTPGAISIGTIGAFVRLRRLRPSEADRLLPGLAVWLMPASLLSTRERNTDVSAHSLGHKRPNGPYSNSGPAIRVFPISERAASQHLHET